MTDQTNGPQPEQPHVQRWNAAKVTINDVTMTNEDAQKGRQFILDHIHGVTQSAITKGDLSDGQQYPFKKAAQDLFRLKALERDNGGLSPVQQAGLSLIENSSEGKLINKLTADHYIQHNPVIVPVAPPVNMGKLLMGSAKAVLLLGLNVGLPLYVAAKIGQTLIQKKKDPATSWKNTTALGLTAVFAATAGGIAASHIENRNLNSLLHYGIGGHVANALVQAAYDDSMHSKGDKDHMEFTESFVRRIWYKGSDATVTAAVSTAKTAVTVGKAVGNAAIIAADVAVDTTAAVRDGIANNVADPDDPDRVAILPDNDEATITALKKQNAAAVSGKTVTVCFNRTDSQELKQGKWSRREDFNQADALAYYETIDQQAEILKADKAGVLHRALNKASNIAVVTEGYKHTPEIRIIPGKTCPSSDYFLAKTYAAPAWIKGFGFEPK